MTIISLIVSLSCVLIVVTTTPLHISMLFTVVSVINTL
jgi:hypothetical protein